MSDKPHPFQSDVQLFTGYGVSVLQNEEFLEKVVVGIAIWHYECLEYTELYVGSVTQSCPTLSDPMDCILPGYSVLGIFQ